MGKNKPILCKLPHVRYLAMIMKKVKSTMSVSYESKWKLDLLRSMGTSGPGDSIATSQQGHSQTRKKTPQRLDL